MDQLILGLRVLVSLAAVLGLMWVLARRLRRGTASPKAKALSVVSRQTVGPKASVVLVDTDGRRFLLGVTEHGISVLHSGEAPAVDALVSSPVGGADREAASVRAAAPVPEAAPAPEATPGLETAPDLEVVPEAVPISRRAARHAVDPSAFDRELQRQLATGPESQPLAGSILDLDTWRQAAGALRAGRRP
ncbi:flagellar biosynthetic protein FliO [Sinomonas albida]|uniref:flagellar biosynthetic protein FliO n=1 Tax=Sinomonas albida TaxID=369942 RepID=UPI00301AD438